MTAAEREASLERLCEQDEGHREDEADEPGDAEPFTAEELAEIREAAADDLLAVEAATTGRRGPRRPPRRTRRARPGRPLASPRPRPRRRGNPKAAWCLTVTGNQGHALAHGCARPEPRSHRKRAGPGPPGGCGT
jgi:hypothetical protein